MSMNLMDKPFIMNAAMFHNFLSWWRKQGLLSLMINS